MYVALSREIEKNSMSRHENNYFCKFSNYTNNKAKVNMHQVLNENKAH